jgi:hypothetical protein
MAVCSLKVLLGIYFANRWNWHIPFAAVIVIAIPVSFVIVFYMKPVNAHLKLKQELPIEDIEAHLLPSANTALDELVWWAKATMAARGQRSMRLNSQECPLRMKSGHSIIRNYHYSPNTSCKSNSLQL